MHGFATNFLNWEVMREYLPDIVAGLWVTIGLAVLVVVSGLLAALLLTVIRAFRLRAVNAVIIIAVDVLRALPPLMLMVTLYFGLPLLGIRLAGFTVAWLVLAAVLAAFAEELLWAGLTSITAGQWEAARSTGLTFAQTLAWVILPQTLRMVIAPLTSRVIATTKNTALASVVAVPELLAQANMAEGYSGNATPLTVAAAGYLLILFPLVIVSRHLERRYGWKRSGR